eukprot:761235-Pyramimonas_sp.AAC.1
MGWAPKRALRKRGPGPKMGARRASRGLSSRMSRACRGHGAQNDDDMRATCALGSVLGPSWGRLGAPAGALLEFQEGASTGREGPRWGPNRGPGGAQEPLL